MEANCSQELGIPDSIVNVLLKTSSSSTLVDALEILIGFSKSDGGRSDLATRGILPVVLKLIEFLSRPSVHRLLLLALRLLRNLCAGEMVNQNLFIHHNGVEVVLSVINAFGFDCDETGFVITRAALQVVANVSLAGDEHQCAIWNRFYPDMFLKIARVRRKESSDPLAMIIYACADGSAELFAELCRSLGLAIIAELVRTASEVGFGEDWLKLLLSRICLEESHFFALFLVLSADSVSENPRDTGRRDIDIHCTSEQAFLLRILSEILNERLKEINICSDFAVQVFEIFSKASTSVDFGIRGQSGLPTGCASIDVLGYSLTMLRDICAGSGSVVAESDGGPEDNVSLLVSRGLLDLLLTLLRELELPSSIRRTMKQGENQGPTSRSQKFCPYKGFRRDIVAVVSNCAYGRKSVQDEVREKNGIVLLLQQCVLDEDNPFLREWGIWSARNLFEGNVKNQQVVADLEMQVTLDVPELVNLGLRVEVDPNTKRAKLVNIS